MKEFRTSSRRIPVYRESAFVFNEIDDAESAESSTDGHEPGRRFVYSRYDNPTVAGTEEQLALLEGSACSWALLTASGMSAIDVALAVAQHAGGPGPILTSNELYSGTNSYLDYVLSGLRRLHVEKFSPKIVSSDRDSFIARIAQLKPSVLYFEPVSNPLLTVIDGRALISAVREANQRVMIVVDNTLATPYLWNPIEDGADIVVHSATKYLSGHGNLTAGVLAGGNPELGREARRYRRLVGSILSPDDAYRLQTQLESFPLRFMRQCESAGLLAGRISEHRAISFTRYPGLASHSTNREATALFHSSLYGAIITFELTGGRAACEELVRRVQPVISYVPTLGNLRTSMLHARSGLGRDYPDGMMRLSVGTESVELLSSCLLDALETVAQ